MKTKYYAGFDSQSERIAININEKLIYQFGGPTVNQCCNGNKYDGIESHLNGQG
jgi:hypothetical protein